METDSSRSSDVKEIVGFLCRWGLLALGVAILAGAGWFAISAVEAAKSEQNPTLFLPDALRRPMENPWPMRGYVVSPSRVPQMALWHLDDGKLSSVFHSFGQIECSSRRVAAGEHKLCVTGNPYSSLAFVNEQSRLRVLNSSGLFLVDAAFVLREAHKGHRDATLSLLQAIRRQKDLALFHTGTAGDALQAQTQLHSMGVADPLLYIVASVPAYIIPRTAADLGLRPQEVQVVTDDPDVAALAGKYGFAASMVNP